jgi:predicted PurR-regulated permease PerM
MKFYPLQTFWGFAVLILIILIWLFKAVLLPFVLGATIAYLLNPLVNKICKKGIKRQTAVIYILGGFFVFMAGLLAIITPILAREAAGFIESAPAYADKIWGIMEPRIMWVQEQLGYKITPDQIQTVIEDNVGKAMQLGKGVLGGITMGGIAIVDFLTTLLITPIAAFFFMKEWPTIVGWVKGIIPRDHIATVSILGKKIDLKISGFVRGQITICLALGFAYAVALSIAGLNYGFVIGLSTGVLSIIPFVGSTLGLVTSVVVAFLQTGGDLTFVGIIACIFFAGQFIEGNFITPKLMGDSVGLHPLWIIFALMAGGSLMGLLGMFLAVPVAASIGVLVNFAVSEYKKSPYYQKNDPTHHKLAKDASENQSTTTPT